MIVLGIDPGQTGGLALVSSLKGGTVHGAILMPVTQVKKRKSVDIRKAENWFFKFHADEIEMAVVEQVSAMPHQGVASSFQFGRMYGGCEAIAALVAERQDYVTPTVWKGAMGLTKDKHASLDLATRLFGQKAAAKYWPLKKHDGVAEAALIALWWLRKYNT